MVLADRRSAFTLIELLTVIAIIGILAALIFPTVGKMRETAQRAVDGSNLREIVKAAQLYAADNNDRLPDPLAKLVSDPRHKSPNPYLFRIEETLACFRRVTAPVLLLSGRDSQSGLGIRIRDLGLELVIQFTGLAIRDSASAFANSEIPNH